MQDGWTNRYLELLGLEHDEPTLDNLHAVARAHRRVGFENVTSLLRRRLTPEGPVPPLDAEAVLESWIEQRSGGLCFEVVPMLGRLLQDLGYDARPVLAQISFPGSHSAILVKLEGARYMVDAGNGQPIFEAIPIDEPSEINRAGLGYRFWLDEASGRLVQDRIIQGTWKPFVHYDLRPATDAEMEASYQRNHALPPQNFVMQNFRLVRCTEDEVAQLRDHEFTRYTADGKTTEVVRDRARYRELVVGDFGFHAMDVEAGLEAWSEITGAEI